MSGWPALAAAATLFFALFTFGSYFGAPYHAGLVALLQLAVMLALCAGAGRVTLKRLGLTDASESQRTLIAITLGLGMLSLCVFGLAAAGALSLRSALIVLGALLALGALEIREVALSLGANRTLLRDRPLASAAILCFLALSLWAAWTPPHQYDSLVYHLALPQDYVRAGGFTQAPLVYAHFPQNGEMLFTLALLLKSDLLAQMFSWLAGALSVWWLFEMGRREAPLSAVLLACLLLVSNTAFLLLSCITYVETFVMLWVTAAVFSFLRWRQLDAAAPGSRGWLKLAACFTGLALGAKYYAGIAAALLGAWIVIRAVAARRGARSRCWRDAAWYVGLTTLVFSPWLVKNAVMAGNPLFPFFNYLFPAREGWNAEIAGGYFGALTEYRHFGTFDNLMRLPLLLLTNNPRFGGGMDVLGTLGWDLTFWVMPLACWAAWKNRFLRWLLAFCAAYFAAWLATGVVLRFLLVLAPLLSLLSANGLYALRLRLGEGGRALLAAGIGVLLSCHLLLFLFVELGVYGSGDVLLGLKTREEFLAAKLDYYPCARYVSERSGKSDRILIVGDQRGYYVEPDHTPTTLNAPNAFIVWANEASNPADFASRLSGAGYTRLLLVPRELKRLGASVGELDARGAANWAGLERDLVEVEFRAPACAVYRLPAQAH